MENVNPDNDEDVSSNEAPTDPEIATITQERPGLEYYSNHPAEALELCKGSNDNPFGVPQNEQFPTDVEHPFDLKAVPGEQLYYILINNLWNTGPATAPEGHNIEFAKAISAFFRDNPHIYWEYLDVENPSVEAIKKLRGEELMKSADIDPRPLHHYVTIGAKRLIRHVNCVIDRFGSRMEPRNDELMRLQMAALTLRYIDDITRKRRKKAAVRPRSGKMGRPKKQLKTRPTNEDETEK